MTAPTRRPFSLLQRAISCASSMNLSSQALENIANQVLRSALSLKHVPVKKEAIRSPSLPSLASEEGRGGVVGGARVAEEREQGCICCTTGRLFADGEPHRDRSHLSPSFETPAHRNRRLPISTLQIAEVGQVRLRWAASSEDEGC